MCSCSLMEMIPKQSDQARNLFRSIRKGEYSTNNSLCWAVHLIAVQIGYNEIQMADEKRVGDLHFFQDEECK